MLNIYPPQDIASGSQKVTDQGRPHKAVWWDLIDATDEENAAVERATGLKVPTREEISEIESSSRLYVDDGAVHVSAPAIHRSDSGTFVVTPIGFVLSPDHLVTVRFAPLASVDSFAAHFGTHGTGDATSSEVFTGLLEAIVDRLADVLEHLEALMDDISGAIFHSEELRPGRADQALRPTLRQIGRIGDHISKLRDALLVLDRMVPFVADHGQAWMSPMLTPRFQTLQRDIASLKDYDEHLSNKVQFLLDASLGLIGIGQSDIFRILTVVSVVGIPPTLVASIYGMNFKNMPELEWAWGYEYGWALILVTAAIPLILCKLRGWI